MKWIRVLTVSLLVIMMWGCATSSPVTGIVTSTTHSGLGSAGVVDNAVPITKEGRSKCISVLGIYAYGDCSVEAAKANGGIKNVQSVSHETSGIAFFYHRYSTIVKGD